MTDLAATIDAAWDDRTNLGLETQGEVRDAVDAADAFRAVGLGLPVSSGQVTDPRPQHILSPDQGVASAPEGITEAAQWIGERGPREEIRDVGEQVPAFLLQRLDLSRKVFQRCGCLVRRRPDRVPVRVDVAEH